MIISPGIPFNFVIIFECEEAGNFQDTLIITTEADDVLEIKIFATNNECDILYEPVVNFGVINIKETKSQKIYIENNSLNDLTLIFKGEQ